MATSPFINNLSRLFNKLSNAGGTALNVGLVGQASNTSVQRISAGAIAPGQTLKTISGQVSINAGATVTINTVTTGKTFYITDISISTDNTVPTDVNIRAGGLTIFRAFVQNTAPIDALGIESQPNGTSGQVVDMVLPTAVGKNVNYFISGFEQ